MSTERLVLKVALALGLLVGVGQVASARSIILVCNWSKGSRFYSSFRVDFENNIVTMIGLPGTPSFRATITDSTIQWGTATWSYALNRYSGVMTTTDPSAGMGNCEVSQGKKIQ